MLPVSALRDMRPFFATPCLGGQTTSVHSASVFALGGDCIKVGMESRLEFHSESLITRSRNLLMVKGLAHLENYTHIVFIDADVLFQSTAVFRLLLADKDVTAGIYPLKKHNWPPIMPPGLTEQQFEERYGTYPFFPTDKESDEDGFCRAYPVTTGLMCIKREVFARMMAAYPERKYVPDEGGDPHMPPDLHYDFFDAFIEPTTRHYWSEDYGFCYLWNAIGGEVWADTNSKLSHHGEHLYRGDLIAHLETRGIIARAEFAEAAE